MASKQVAQLFSNNHPAWRRGCTKSHLSLCNDNLFYVMLIYFPSRSFKRYPCVISTNLHWRVADELQIFNDSIVNGRAFSKLLSKIQLFTMHIAWSVFPSSEAMPTQHIAYWLGETKLFQVFFLFLPPKGIISNFLRSALSI